MAMRCTQWPTSAVGFGMPSDSSPRLIGCHVWPPSSVRKAPAAEMAMNDPLRVGRIEDDRVQAHAAGAGLPSADPMPWPRKPASSCQFCPPSVDLEQRGILDAGVDGVGIGQRRLEMPDALELPGMRRAVVPLVRAGNAVVVELVADRLPGLAAVVGALDQLAEPAAGLRRIESIRIDGRSLDVVNLPAARSAGR